MIMRLLFILAVECKFSCHHSFTEFYVLPIILNICHIFPH